MNSQILIVEFWNVCPHLETAGEIGLCESLKSNQVDFHFLGSAVPFNECYLREKDKVPREIKLGHLTSDLINWKFITIDDLKLTHQENIFSFNSIPELKRFTHDGFPVGLYVYCNLCDLTKLADPELENNYNLINLLINSYLYTYKYVDKLLKQSQYNKVLTFNGRHINHAAVKDAAKHNNTKMSYHERGGDNSKYWYESERTHNVDSFQKILKEKVKYFEDHESEESISLFKSSTLASKLELFSNAKGFDWAKEGKSPKLKIAYLASSVDEFEYFLSEPHLSPGGIWRDQRSAIIDILSTIETLGVNAHLTVRLHPYEANKPVQTQQLWKILQNKDNITLLMPDSNITSYDVAKEADMIFVFHSSIAPDLLINQKKVYGMNGSSFDFLRSVQNISTLEQLNKAISSVYNQVIGDNDEEQLSHLVDDGIKYLYALQNVGHSYLYYQATGPHRGHFLGVYL